MARTHNQICELFSRYGIFLTEEMIRRADLYISALQSENLRQNLTKITDYDEVWVRHILDSAMLLRFLPDHSRILDLGTGAGIPGIPLMILNPTLEITLMDSEQSKIAFCEQVLASVIGKGSAICGRAEDMAKSAHLRGKYDYVVSRAMASGSMLSELGLPFLKVGGSLLAMKGRQFDDAVERFTSAASVLGGDPPVITQYTVEDEVKTLVSIRKIAETPEKYPRRFAKIKREPL